MLFNIPRFVLKNRPARSVSYATRYFLNIAPCPPGAFQRLDDLPGNKKCQYAFKFLPAII